jgi:hypothetical protein
MELILKMLCGILSQVQIDELIEERGQNLHLPPYNCQLHHTELVWSQARRYTIAPSVEMGL